MVKTLKTTFILLILLIGTNVFSQTKVQKLYEAKKYEKCIKLCDKNIKENTGKLSSILYKSMVLTDAFENEAILNLYPSPIYEALKGISKIEKNRKLKPKDKFYVQNKRNIKRITEESLSVADTFFVRGDNKRALKIYKKLKDIYPSKELYTFKIAKTYDFKTEDILRKHSGISEKELHETIYEIASNSSRYLKKGGKKELENALEKLYHQPTCDLETASTLLVFLKQNYKSSTKAKSLSEQFQAKYQPIDMLIKVNEHRAKGYTCGDKKMNDRPPLILDNCLIRTTQKYAELMEKENHFSHTGPDGKSPWTRASDEGCYSDGENIAWGSGTVPGALRQWMESPGHCKNIMGHHTHMGIGESGSYWVQMFR